MFEITLSATSMDELAKQVSELAASLTPTQLKSAKPAPKAAPAPQPVADEVDAELLAPAPPAPATAASIVDAGTGQPIAAPTKMTFDDVKVAAAKLAAMDTPKLKELILKYGGTNLSSIPKENLGSFAEDVLAAT